MITLVLGGARSGKSAVAEGLAGLQHGPVTYVATMNPAGDTELEARVDAHRLRRDPQWVTIESGADLPGLLRSLHGTVLVDSLGPWVSAHLGGESVATVSEQGTSLCAALVERDGDTVLVSDEVGLAVHPSTPEGRQFRDALGTLNHAVSAVADRAFLVVAGRAMALPPAGVPAG